MSCHSWVSSPFPHGEHLPRLPLPIRRGATGRRHCGGRIFLGTCLCLAMLALGGKAFSQDVVIDEILYHPDPGNEGGEFIELHNRGSSPVDLTGWMLTDAVSFTFGPGTVLGPGERLVVVANVEAAKRFYGISNIAGAYSGQLDNAGETIVLLDGGDPLRMVDRVVYDDSIPWPPEADGGGPSLELADPASDNDLPSSWALGSPYSPGKPNRPVPAGPGPVVISEIMYHPRRGEPRESFDPVTGNRYVEVGDDEYGEYLELFNRSPSPVDLSGWRFTDGISFRFPGGTVLSPGGRLIVAASPPAIQARFHRPALGPFEGSLDNGGERITLCDAVDQLVNTVRYDDLHPWPVAPDASGASLECVDPFEDNSIPSNWRASRTQFAAPIDSVLDLQGWQFLQVAGTATSQGLCVYLDGSGEWLIDDVALRPAAGGQNLIPDGSFETGDGGWAKIGNHSGASWTDEEAHSGAGSERLLAAGAGDGADNNIRIPAIPAVVPGEEYILTLWAKHRSGARSLTVQMEGGGLLQTIAAPQRFHLAADWSESLNPAGAWSYRNSGGNLIRQHLLQWLPGDLGPNQPAWTDAGSGGIPGWAQSNGSSKIGPHPEYDFPVGSVMSHGPSEVRWTSPGDGIVAIRGGVWFLRHIGRSQLWRIRKNEATLTSGALISEDTSIDSSRPLSFDSGSGGPAALLPAVAAGDALRFSCEPYAGVHDFVGYSIEILFLPGDPSSEQGPWSRGQIIGSGTPGEINSVDREDVPPLVMDLEASPPQPRSTEEVLISAYVWDDDPIVRVEVLYALGLGQDFFSLPMFDDGLHDDRMAGDGIFAAKLPPRPSGTLVHYRVRAEDALGSVTTFPFEDDPSPTQAYFHDDGKVDTGLTLFQLFISPENLARLDAQPRSDDYVDCSLAIDGTAYPHIGIRYRGRRSRTDPKHPWKIRFNRDQLYNGNRTVDTMIWFPFEQWIGFKIFDLAGVPNLESDLVRIHLNGQFWGVYIAFESPSESWLEKHGLHPAGEIYKARTVETAGQAKNSDLFHNQIVTDDDYWGSWNKLVRPLEPPSHIRELTDALNDLSDSDLLPWLDLRVDLDAWFGRWALNILMNIDDFAGHNYDLYLPGDPGGKWKVLGYDFDSGFSYSRVGPLRALYGDGFLGDSPDWQRNKFCQRVSTNPTLRRLYFLKMKGLIDKVFRPADLFPMIDDLFRLTDRDRPLDIARWGTMRSDTTEMKSVLQSQRDRMLSFLATQGLPAPSILPIVDPPGGSFHQPVPVSLTTAQGWSAAYSLDGSDPRLSKSPTFYAAPFPVERSLTLRTAAVKGPRESGNWTEIVECRFLIGSAPPPVGPLLRADCNGDGSVDISDALRLLCYMFLGDAPPGCPAACDMTRDGALDVSDAIALLEYLFLGGDQPPAPFPGCGTSSQESDLKLGCRVPAACP